MHRHPFSTIHRSASPRPLRIMDALGRCGCALFARALILAFIIVAPALAHRSRSYGASSLAANVMQSSTYSSADSLNQEYAEAKAAEITIDPEKEARLTARPANRPKIGLILSGGGAWGMAHVGVLRVLDSLGIVPDYITGTSMGALIGALYAIGYSTDTIDYLLKNVNWDYLLSNTIPLDEVALDRKGEIGQSQMSFTWREGAFKLPMGLIESQSLWNLFYRLTWPVAHLKSFDDFPIPYRCCAVNLGNATTTTFNSGSLAMAMRASMSVPGIFAPVISGDTAIYVDGGVENNFPFDEIKKMGADIVIGVYTGSKKLNEKTKTLTAQNILVYSSMFAGYKRALHDIQRCDVLIVPDVSPYTSASFSVQQPMIDSGYNAAMRNLEALEMVAKQQMHYYPPSTLPNRPEPIQGAEATQHVKRIIVHSEHPSTRNFVIHNLGIKTPVHLNANTLDESLKSLYSTLYFKKINYIFDPQGTLHIYPTPVEPANMQVGVNLNNVWGPSLILRMTALSQIAHLGRFNLDAEIAQQPRVQLAYSTYFTRRLRTLFSTQGTYSLSKMPYYLGQTQIASLWQHEVDADIKFAFLLKKNLMLEIGSSYHLTSSKPSQAYIEWFNLDDPERINLHDISLFLGARINTVDRHLYPKKGIRFYARGNYNLYNHFSQQKRQSEPELEQGIENTFSKSPQSFNVVARMEAYFPLAHWLTAEVQTDLGLSTQRSGRLSTFRIGGHPFTQRNEHYDAPALGLRYRQISTYNYIRIEAATRFRLWDELHLTLRGNLITAHDELLQLPKTFINWREHIYTGALSLGYVSRFGLVEGAISFSNLSKLPELYLTVGFPF